MLLLWVIACACIHDTSMLTSMIKSMGHCTWFVVTCMNSMGVSVACTMRIDGLNYATDCACLYGTSMLASTAGHCTWYIVIRNKLSISCALAGPYQGFSTPHLFLGQSRNLTKNLLFSGYSGTQILLFKA
jgi:hypothetical protein